MARFEDDNGTLRYLAADDDSGAERNATVHAKLLSGHKYVLGVHMHYSKQTDVAVMMY